MTITTVPLKEPGPIITSSESDQLRCGYVVLEPGRDIGKHTTENGEEVLVILEGTAEIIVGSRTNGRVVHAPSAVLIPAHTVHNVLNRSRGVLKYVYIVLTRPWSV